MSKKIDKEMLKNPDVFVNTSDHVFDFIEKHFKSFLAVVGTIAVLAVGYVAYGYIQSANEQKAAEALYKPEAELKKAESDVFEAKNKKVDKKAATPAPAAPVDFAKTYAPAVDKIVEQIRSHADSKAGFISALNLSSFLMQQKQYAKALEVLNLPKYKPSESNELTGFWMMHRGLVYLENNQVDQAIESYQKVLANASLKPFQPEAMLKLGLCYEVKGDVNKARETYEKLGREFPKTEASTTAEQFLRLLDLKKQG